MPNLELSPASVSQRHARPGAIAGVGVPAAASVSQRRWPRTARRRTLRARAGAPGRSEEQRRAADVDESRQVEATGAHARAARAACKLGSLLGRGPRGGVGVGGRACRCRGDRRTDSSGPERRSRLRHSSMSWSQRSAPHPEVSVAKFRPTLKYLPCAAKSPPPTPLSSIPLTPTRPAVLQLYPP